MSGAKGAAVSAIDDIIGAVAIVIDRLGEASAGAQSAESEAGEALDQAVALGASAAIEGLVQVKDQLETLLGQLSTVAATASEALTTARAVAAST